MGLSGGERVQELHSSEVELVVWLIGEMGGWGGGSTVSYCSPELEGMAAAF